VDTRAPIFLRIERDFDAPPEMVYRAWTDPAHLAKWWGPEGMSAGHVELDVRVGGKYRCSMVGGDGSEMWVQGIYREVVDSERLVFTWAWETDGEPGPSTTITLEFRQIAGGTRLIVVHEGFETEDARDRHESGWSSSLDCLGRVL
jgi:uncharacterized protein YndB with AHSA1/START domain